ncbi:hypothetical protein CEXT_10641 [Caerostris extrusa]|uniref:Uncharacterized protein n=1 Tax=Caerostris extrusa TaxID=172846 RepID=A0AAV4P649_CAEEX|nr:hypothetical protein CEXT_10641 [Caerostris extrusa]
MSPVRGGGHPCIKSLITTNKGRKHIHNIQNHRVIPLTEVLFPPQETPRRASPQADLEPPGEIFLIKIGCFAVPHAFSAHLWHNGEPLGISSAVKDNAGKGSTAPTFYGVCKHFVTDCTCQNNDTKPTFRRMKEKSHTIHT